MAGPLNGIADNDSLEAAYDHRDEIKRRLQDHFIQKSTELLGQHTVEILQEEGLDEGDIADLLERGIVEGESHG